MPSRCPYVVAATVLATLPLPATKLIDFLARGCGDGLCGFFSGLMVLGSLGGATLVLLALSTRRGETPAVLRLLPLILWALALVPLTL